MNSIMEKAGVTSKAGTIVFSPSGHIYSRAPDLLKIFKI